MRNRLMGSMVAVAAVLAFSSAALAQAGQQQATAPAPKRDLSGVWYFEGRIYGASGAGSTAAEKDMPPMTPWAQAMYDAERPGAGTRGAPGGNDPILQCDPIGFPRIMFVPTPFELVQVPGRVLQFFEREHEWRPIWTDGRSLPKDPDPAWYGYSIGHWEGDDTLVTEAVGFNDKTWLGSTGYPHSEDMRVTERYQRVDHDTILYNITVEDPKAYTKPIVGPQRTLKLHPNVEIEQHICAWSEETSFARRIREPASAKPKK